MSTITHNRTSIPDGELVQQLKHQEELRHFGNTGRQRMTRVTAKNIHKRRARNKASAKSKRCARRK